MKTKKYKLAESAEFDGFAALESTVSASFNILLIPKFEI